MSGEPTAWSASQVDVTLSAIRDQHRRAGLPSPTTDQTVQRQRRQYRADWSAANKEARATPLTVAALRDCVEYQPIVGLPDLQRAAAALLLVDCSGVSANDLARLRLADLRCEQQVELHLGGRWQPVSCTCTRRAAHWRTPPCAACLLRQMEQALVDEDGQLFVGGPTVGASARPVGSVEMSILRVINSVSGSWPALSRIRAGRLAWVSDDEDARAATRHGLGLALTRQLHLLQLRVLLDVSFARGLRFSDAQRLALNPSARRPSDYRLHLPVSKGDQAGVGRWLYLLPADDYALCPVCALDEWLWIRLAATPPTDPAPLLLCGIGRGGLRPEARLDYATTWMHLKPIREASGAGAFSLHSMRRGFAALALEQGATEHQVQAVLGHAKLDTTKRYLDAGRHGEIPPGLQRLAGQPSTRAAAQIPAENRTARPPHGLADHCGPAGTGGCGR